MSTVKVNKIEKRSGSTLTLGGPGTAVTIACGATTVGMGRTGTVDWCTTAKTSPLTVASGNGYFINTSGGAITVTLPSSPSAGDIVAFKDYAGTWAEACKAVAVCRGGSKINGQCSNASLNTESQSVTLIYVDGTKGWQDIHDSTSNVTGATFVSASGGNTTITCGNFKTHIFTGDGTFTVSSISNVAANNVVEYLVVGGGGQGGNGADSDGYAGGGGGAGGFRIFSTAPGSNSPLVAPAGVTVTATGFPVSIGGGGTGPCGPGGVASTFSTITSAGGGAGAITNNPSPSEPPSTRINGVSAGSGGGGSSKSGSDGTAGSGNTPPVSPPQGNNGGNGTRSGNTGGGGGGGAGAVGSAAAASDGGDGGVGSYIADPFIGPTAPSYGTPGPVSNVRYFSGGGGGASGYYPANPGTGFGTGGAGGGSAGVTTGDTVNAGPANTGGGAGGASGANATPTNANGASGVVMIRYRFQ
jgi:hypothetical protein